MVQVSAPHLLGRSKGSRSSCRQHQQSFWPSIRARSSDETAAEKDSMTKFQLFHDASSPAKLEGFPSERMSTIEADEVFCYRRSRRTSRCFQSRNPVVRFVQRGPSLLQCLFQLLQSFFPRCHRDTISEQTNAEVRNSAPQKCTGDRKHGHVKQRFSTQTQNQSLSRMARCACMTMRNNQPCTHVSQDDNYQTSQECSSNRHFSLDLSHSSSQKFRMPQKNFNITQFSEKTNLTYTVLHSAHCHACENVSTAMSKMQFQRQVLSASRQHSNLSHASHHNTLHRVCSPSLMRRATERCNSGQTLITNQGNPDSQRHAADAPNKSAKSKNLQSKATSSTRESFTISGIIYFHFDRAQPSVCFYCVWRRRRRGSTFKQQLHTKNVSPVPDGLYSGCNICLADVWREASPFHENSLNQENIHELNISQLLCIITIPVLVSHHNPLRTGAALLDGRSVQKRCNCGQLIQIFFVHGEQTLYVQTT